jgi:hypothetical protein
MPSSFGTGLISGVIDGWTKQSEQMDQVKRKQKQQDIENNLKIINAQDLPDDVKQNSAQQLQDLMQGKKPGGKGGGQLSPVLQNLLKMIGKSHGGQGQSSQGGATEKMPNGQAAPGTGGSTPGAGFPQGQQQPPPLPQRADGRPTLQGSGPAAADPGNAPRPFDQTGQNDQGGSQQQPKQSTLDTQIETVQRAMEGTKNPITKQKLADRLGQLTDMKIKQEAEEAKEARTETGKEALEKLKSDHSTELQKLKDDSAKAIADAKAVSAKEAAEAKVKAEKDLEDLKEKHRAELKKVIPGKAAGAGGGESKAQTKRFQQLEDKKNANLRTAEQHFATAKAKADQLPKGEAKGNALRDAMDALNNAKAQAQTEYANGVKQAAKGGGKDDRVTVVSPDGKKGTIPRSQLEDAKSQGFKEAA